MPYYGFEPVDLATNHGDAVGGDCEAWLRTQLNGIEAVRGHENGIPKPEYDVPRACVRLKSKQWSTH